MHPCTSYCPPTSVAARKLGNKRVSRAALGCRSPRCARVVRPGCVRPACCIRDCRSTGSHSGTCGSVRIAATGSPFGMRGISTIPAPRRPRPLPIVDEPVRAVRTDAVRADGVAEALGRRRGRHGLRCCGVHRVRARCRRRRSSRRRRSRRSPVRRISFGLPPLVDDQLLVVRDRAGHGTEVARSSRQQAGCDSAACQQVSILAQPEPGRLRLVCRQPSLELAATVEQALRELLFLTRRSQRGLDPVAKRP